MDRSFTLDDRTLLAGIPRLGMPLDHIDAFYRRLALSRKHLQYLADTSFIFSGDYLYLIISFQVCSAFPHLSTYRFSLELSGTGS